VYGFGSSKTPEGFQQACTRFIDITRLPNEDAPEKPDKPVIDEDVVKLIGDAWKASKRDGEGFASLSEVGQRVGNLKSFDARSYGFSRLSDMIESLPNFVTGKAADGQISVKRVR
jgi:hypothetical protein